MVLVISGATPDLSLRVLVKLPTNPSDACLFLSFLSSFSAMAKRSFCSCNLSLISPFMLPIIPLFCASS